MMTGSRFFKRINAHDIDKCIDFLFFGSKIRQLTCVEAQRLSVHRGRVMPFIPMERKRCRSVRLYQEPGAGISTERADTVTTPES
ncbi:hypothetical protein B6S08_00720 [Oceanimonas doudoroffii]|uniref:Uncharacterized protein n=1 Tax=Oceanimonas doudoroffii TaxID=84158 RepID=A0A233RFC0_9GAMM|nr:hypothetical protein B6S08_00720 [Oceanimonas doudoroffii]